jgi:hypothetical protein
VAVVVVAAVAFFFLRKKKKYEVNENTGIYSGIFIAKFK